MGRFRSLIREAREQLHEYMSVPALYLAQWPVPVIDPDDPDPPAIIAPQEITVRIHDKYLLIGDLKGTNFHYAERYDYAPRVIFMRSEIDRPQKPHIISVAPGIAYRVDAVEPPDDITVAATMIRVSVADTVGMPVPDET